MSNKALKNLLKQQKKEEEPIQEEIEVEIKPTQKKNVFQMLDEDNVEIEDQEEEEFDFTTKPTKNSKKSKKKKNKKKQQDDDIFDEFKETPSKQEEKVEKENSFKILEIEVNNLNPDNEYRKLFGSQVIPKTKKKFHRQTFFVTPKDHWPLFKNPGLEMKNENENFTFVRDQEYQRTTDKYQYCVESHDPNNLMELLQHNPYHVETLIQMSEVFMLNNENDKAQDLLERAIFTLELCFSKQFFTSVCLGQARLSIKKEENVSLYNVLVKRIHTLGKSGCHATSLELCKFLYSLDPSGDPYHVCLFIDYYAHLAQEYKFIVDFVEFTSNYGLDLLPNLVYSKAFALFKLKDEKNASKCLQEALLLYPMTLTGFIEKGKWEVDKWSSLITNTIFLDLVCTSQLFLSMMQIASQRNASLLDGPFQKWFEENVKIVIELSKDSKLMKDYETKRNDIYVKSCFKPYTNVTFAEIDGKVLPNQDTYLSSQSTLFGSNPFFQFFATLFPWTNQQTPQQEE